MNLILSIIMIGKIIMIIIKILQYVMIQLLFRMKKYDVKCRDLSIHYLLYIYNFLYQS